MCKSAIEPLLTVESANRQAGGGRCYSGEAEITLSGKADSADARCLAPAEQPWDNTNRGQFMNHGAEIDDAWRRANLDRGVTPIHQRNDET